MRRCITSFPRLGTLVADPLALSGIRGPALQPYRKLIVELAQASAIEQLQDLAAQQAESTTDELRVKRGRIFRLLQRLAPGRSSGLAAVVNRFGEVLTDPTEMASALREYWQDVFAHRGVDQQLLDRWLSAASQVRGSSGAALSELGPWPRWHLLPRVAPIGSTGHDHPMGRASGTHGGDTPRGLGCLSHDLQW